MSDGNKRKMSEVGIVCQHYLIVLKGNEQKLEINSNLETLARPALDERRISNGRPMFGIA